MIKNIKGAIVTLTLIAGMAFTATATPTPLKMPAAKTQQQNMQDVARAFVEEAYENARLNSPFANFDAAPAAEADIDKGKAVKLLDYASRFLGTRYRLGATGPKAFDCSGFTSYVFRQFGIQLNRTSRMQYLQGRKVSPKALRPGDLLFFSCRSSGRGNVGHVAIVSDVDPETGSCRFIHASVKKGVTYQKFPDGGYFDRNFIGAKRVL